jgi:hypothetical protein
MSLGHGVTLFSSYDNCRNASGTVFAMVVNESDQMLMSKDM